MIKALPHGTYIYETLSLILQRRYVQPLHKLKKEKKNFFFKVVIFDLQEIYGVGGIVILGRTSNRNSVL